MRPGRAGTPRSELLLYLFAAVTYIAAGFLLKEIFAWWIYGAAWFVAVVWFGPPVLSWVRGRFARPRSGGEDGA